MEFEENNHAKVGNPEVNARNCKYNIAQNTVIESKPRSLNDKNRKADDTENHSSRSVAATPEMVEQPSSGTNSDRNYVAECTHKTVPTLKQTSRPEPFRQNLASVRVEPGLYSLSIVEQRIQSEPVNGPELSAPDIVASRKPCNESAPQSWTDLEAECTSSPKSWAELKVGTAVRNKSHNTESFRNQIGTKVESDEPNDGSSRSQTVENEAASLVSILASPAMKRSIQLELNTELKIDADEVCDEPPKTTPNIVETTTIPADNEVISWQINIKEESSGAEVGGTMKCSEAVNIAEKDTVQRVNSQLVTEAFEKCKAQIRELAIAAHPFGKDVPADCHAEVKSAPCPKCTNSPNQLNNITKICRHALNDSYKLYSQPLPPHPNCKLSSYELRSMVKSAGLRGEKIGNFFIKAYHRGEDPHKLLTQLSEDCIPPVCGFVNGNLSWPIKFPGFSNRFPHPHCKFTLQELKSMAEQIPESFGLESRMKFIYRCYVHGKDPSFEDWTQYQVNLFYELEDLPPHKDCKLSIDELKHLSEKIPESYGKKARFLFVFQCYRCGKQPSKSHFMRRLKRKSKKSRKRKKTSRASALKRIEPSEFKGSPHPECMYSIDELKDLAAQIPESFGNETRVHFIRRCYQQGRNPHEEDWTKYNIKSTQSDNQKPCRAVNNQSSTRPKRVQRSKKSAGIPPNETQKPSLSKFHGLSAKATEFQETHPTTCNPLLQNPLVGPDNTLLEGNHSLEELKSLAKHIEDHVQSVTSSNKSHRQLANSTGYHDNNSHVGDISNHSLNKLMLIASQIATRISECNARMISDVTPLNDFNQVDDSSRLRATDAKNMVYPQETMEMYVQGNAHSSMTQCPDALQAGGHSFNLPSASSSSVDAVLQPTANSSPLRGRFESQFAGGFPNDCSSDSNPVHMLRIPAVITPPASHTPSIFSTGPRYVPPSTPQHSMRISDSPNSTTAIYAKQTDSYKLEQVPPEMQRDINPGTPSTLKRKTPNQEPTLSKKFRINQEHGSPMIERCESVDTIEPLFIVHTGYPNERLTEEQMDLVESNILEAILDVDSDAKPAFKESFRSNGRYGLVCGNGFTKKWICKFLEKCHPWPNASLRIIPDGSKVRVNAELPLCKDDNEKILKFIGKQNAGLNVRDWEVVERWDISESKTCMILMVDKDSAKVLRNCSNINFKLTCGKVVFSQKECCNETSSSRSEDVKAYSDQGNHKFIEHQDNNEIPFRTSEGAQKSRQCHSKNNLNRVCSSGRHDRTDNFGNRSSRGKRSRNQPNHTMLCCSLPSRDTNQLSHDELLSILRGKLGTTSSGEVQGSSAANISQSHTLTQPPTRNLSEGECTPSPPPCSPRN